MILGDANSVSHFKLGFCVFSKWLAVEGDQKVAVFGDFWDRVDRSIPSRIQVFDKVSQFVNVLLSIVFHVMEKISVNDRFVRSVNAAVVLPIVVYICIP